MSNQMKPPKDKLVTHKLKKKMMELRRALYLFWFYDLYRFHVFSAGLLHGECQATQIQMSFIWEGHQSLQLHFD